MLEGQLKQAEAGGARGAELETELAAAITERVTLAARVTELESELAKLGDDVADRDRRLTESTNEMARLTREHRAALTEVERKLREATTAVEAAPADEAEPEPETVERAHQLFVPSAAGYELREREGAAPSSGTVVELGDLRFVVRRVGPSPLPVGPRRCVFLERL